MMKTYLILTIPFLIAGIAACNQAPKSTVSVTDSTNVIKETSNDTLNMYNAYIILKNDLVKGDAKVAQQSAGNLVKPLSAIKGCDEAKGFAQKMSAESDIKSQRKLFLQLSQDLIPLVKGLKVKKSPIYIAYCPMTNGGKGGYWLSEKKQIENPYYGGDMLECGEVKEEIK
jgi:hypothetical protein